VTGVTSNFFQSSFTVVTGKQWTNDCFGFTAALEENHLAKLRL